MQASKNEIFNAVCATSADTSFEQYESSFSRENQFVSIRAVLMSS